jgi:small subunit ribosomal protein S17
MSKKRLEGIISALSGTKTVAVDVVRFFHLPIYRKRVRASKTYLAHFDGDAKVGQGVVIEGSRPISKRKSWVVVEIEGQPVVKKQQEVVSKEVVSKEGGKARQRKVKR